MQRNEETHCPHPPTHAHTHTKKKRRALTRAHRDMTDRRPSGADLPNGYLLSSLAGDTDFPAHSLYYLPLNSLAVGENMLHLGGGSCSNPESWQRFGLDKTTTRGQKISRKWKAAAVSLFCLISPILPAGFVCECHCLHSARGAGRSQHKRCQLSAGRWRSRSNHHRLCRSHTPRRSRYRLLHALSRLTR